LTDKSSLYEQLQKIKRQGFAYDLQESVIGFCCAAAPVRDVSGHLIAAVSCSMPSHVWEDKKERAVEEITKLARRLTLIHE
jgi:DNA-binding IclR family transcriptional regulator